MSELAQIRITKCKATKSKTLDLGNCGLTKIPKEVFDCVWVESLMIANEYWDSKNKKWIKSKNHGKKNHISEIPLNIKQLNKLKKLLLNGEKDNEWEISDISPLSQLSNLRTLTLSFNQISEIDSLIKLVYLQTIYFDHNPIFEKIPQRLRNSQNAKGIIQWAREFYKKDTKPISDIVTAIKQDTKLIPDVAPAVIQDAKPIHHLVPEVIQNKKKSSDLAQRLILECKALQTPILDLGNCGLTEIPEEVCDCVWLEKLIISNRYYDVYRGISVESKNEGEKNIISEIPLHIEKLSQLKVLFLSNYSGEERGEMTDITPLEGLVNLQELHLENNHIKNIDSLSKLKNLKVLSLHNNVINNIDALGQLYNLETLYLGINQIQSIESLSQLINLQLLFLFDNQIQSIKSLQPLINLKVLHLSNNHLQSVEYLQSLINLEVLHIGNNQIQSIESLRPLINLNTLILESNQIQSTESLSSLINLEKLDIENNLIENIESLVPLINLKSLNISNNPIIDKIPDEVINTFNTMIILQWAREYYQEGAKFIALKQAKILLLGNTNVGKSFLLHYLESGVIPRNLESTKGLQYSSFEKFGLKLNIYDFGGQEYFHGTHQLFFGEGALHLVLWTEDRQPREGQEDRCFELTYWLRCIEQLSKDKQKSKSKSIETILIENKIDRGEGEDLKFEPTLLDFTEFVSEFSELNLNHTAISLTQKQRLAGMLELIEERLKTLSANNENWTQTYQNVIDVISKQKDDGVTVLKINEIVLKDMKSEDIQIMIPIFHNLGILLFYPAVTSVKDLVFINPQAFLDVLYKEILNDDCRKNSGKLTKNDFNKPNELNLTAEQILDLLRYFHVVFEVKQGKNEFFAPQYLPDKSHSLLDFFIEYNFQKATLRLESDSYLLNLVMLQIFTEFGKTVMGNRSDDYRDYLFWRDGIVIEKDKQLLYIQYHREEQYIDLYADKNFKNFELQKEIVDWVLNHTGEEKDWKQLIGDDWEIYKSKSHSITWENNPYFKISASTDGESFAKWADIQQTKVARFSSNGKEFNLADFKPYLKEKNQMKKIFISYSKQDEKMVNDFIKHLSTLTHNKLVETWYCTELKAGEEWEDTIQSKLNEADIVCFMISPNFMETPYIHKYEVKNALKRYDADKSKIKIVPILLDFCNWSNIYEIEQTDGKKKDYKLTDFTGLPFTMKPIRDFQNPNEGWLIVEDALSTIIRDDLIGVIDSADLVRKMPIQVRKIYERITGDV